MMKGAATPESTTLGVPPARSVETRQEESVNKERWA